MRRRHAPPPFEVMSQNWKSASESFDEEGQDGVSQMSAGQSPMRDSNRSVSSEIALKGPSQNFHVSSLYNKYDTTT